MSKVIDMTDEERQKRIIQLRNLSSTGPDDPGYLSDDNDRNGRRCFEEMDDASETNSLYLSDSDSAIAESEEEEDGWEFDYEESSKQQLGDRLIVSLALLDIKRSGGLSVKGLRDISNLFKVVRPDLAPYDWRTTESHMGERTGIYFERYDVCRNNCYCFPPLQEDPNFLECPLCYEPRFKPSYGNNVGKKKKKKDRKPFITFDYIPIIHRLRLQFANPHRVQLMRTYKESVLKSTNSKGEPLPLTDYWRAKLHQGLMQKGILVDPDEIGFVFGTDGFQVFKARVSKQCWPLLLVNLNLPPDVRYVRVATVSSSEEN